MISRTPSVESSHLTGRIGIILLSGLGDVVHGLPVARALKRENPGCEIVWIAEPAPSEVLLHNPAVDRIVVFDSWERTRGLTSLARELKDLRCDITINLHRYAKSALPLMLTRAPVRLGLPPFMTREGLRFFHTHALPGTRWRHTQDTFLSVLEHFGIPREDPVRWGIRLNSAERNEGIRFRARVPDGGGRPLCALVLGSAHPAKDWPRAGFAPLIRGLRERGFAVALIGGPGREDRETALWIAREAPPVYLDGRTDSVRTMMARLASADLVISPDTGPLHIAHALGIPVIGLFGHTNPARVGPWRDFRDLTIDRYTEPGERPSAHRYAPKEGRMARIAPEEVLARVDLARERYLSPSQS